MKKAQKNESKSVSYWVKTIVLSQTYLWLKKCFQMRAPQFEHPWLLTTLKGHVSDVVDLDFSSNGRYLSSVSSDRSLYLWNVKASVIYTVV